MEKQKLQINPTALTPEQRDKLDEYQQAQDQLQVLQDIAVMTQELIMLMDDQKKEGQDTYKGMGALLVDMRDSLTALKDKKAPEMPDYAKPVVDAVGKLEKALSTSIKGIDVRPEVNLSAPEVTVPIDMSGVEKAMQAIPRAFEKAIKLIPKVEVPQTDFQPLLDAWQGISEQLESIETATRMKPIPGSIKVSNLSEISSGSATAANQVTGNNSLSSIDTKLSSVTPPSVASVTSVNDTASSTTLLASNASRKEAIIQNDSSSILYIKHGTTASATSYTAKLYTDDLWRTEYTGRIDGIWSADSTGFAAITELT